MKSLFFVHQNAQKQQGSSEERAERARENPPKKRQKKGGSSSKKPKNSQTEANVARLKNTESDPEVVDGEENCDDDEDIFNPMDTLKPAKGKSRKFLAFTKNF